MLALSSFQFDPTPNGRVRLGQFDAFAEYVAAAEEHGVESYPLYQWRT